MHCGSSAQFITGGASIAPLMRTVRIAPLHSTAETRLQENYTPGVLGVAEPSPVEVLGAGVAVGSFRGAAGSTVRATEAIPSPAAPSILPMRPVMVLGACFLGALFFLGAVFFFAAPFFIAGAFLARLLEAAVF